MTEGKLLATISDWWRVAQVGSLILPDGWFGRPHDNQHRLTYLAGRKHKVILELDDQLLLTFTDLRGGRVEDSELVLRDFAQLVFDWQEYGSLTPHASVYDQGEVKLVPPPGVTIPQTA